MRDTYLVTFNICGVGGNPTPHQELVTVMASLLLTRTTREAENIAIRKAYRRVSRRFSGYVVYYLAVKEL